MSSLLYSLGFHRTGKPRRWLRFVLFREDWTARPLLRRFVHKKNGRVRPRFAYWVNEAQKLKQETISNGQAAPVRLQHPRPEELALQAMVPFEDTVKSWRGRADPTAMMDKAGVLALISGEGGVQAGRLLVSVGQDNYRKVTGGVQLCIQHEETMAVARGETYLQVHPWHPLPRLAHADEDPDTILALVLNGADAGACRTSALIAAVADAVGRTQRDVRLVVHHMLGHLPEQIATLAQATGTSRCIFWLHDFFSICPSYTLQRNGIAFCNAPPVTSNACGLCVFGAERVLHQRRMAAFFAAVQVDVASPSKVTAAFWEAKAGLKAQSVTEIPHVVLDVAPRPAPLTLKDEPRITVGYLGAQVQHKGWPVFTRLMHEFGAAAEYRFVVLSSKRPALNEDRWVPVQVTAELPDAMVSAVAQEDVDIVLHWPAWPETFSFTTFEALAGTAYVLTHAGSGNIAAAVQALDRGAVLRDEADLDAFFRDGRAKALAEKRRAARNGLAVVQRRSQMSYPLLEKAY